MTTMHHPFPQFLEPDPDKADFFLIDHKVRRRFRVLLKNCRVTNSLVEADAVRHGTQLPFEEYNVASDMYDFVRTTWPYWNRSVRRRTGTLPTALACADLQRSFSKMCAAPPASGCRKADAPFRDAHLRPRPPVRWPSNGLSRSCCRPLISSPGAGDPPLLSSWACPIVHPAHSLF